MKFLAILNELAGVVGLGDVTPDEKGCVTLLFDRGARMAVIVHSEQ